MARLDQVARTRAYIALARSNPKVFKRLLDKERAALGLPPVGTTPPGPVPRHLDRVDVSPNFKGKTK